ncbi:MAG: hypothetical protein Q7W16_02495 [Coriobacteriia bacterium]|nr:hypothetical protein [Coriobacteriia bacterium]
MRPSRLMPIMLAIALILPSAAFAAVGTGARTATSTTAVPAATPASVTPAPASPSTPVAAAVPAAVEVQLWPSEPDGFNVVVSAQLAESVKLPATVRIPVPAGVTLGWVGEVFGGDPAKDVKRAYIIEEGTGGRVLVVTLTQSRMMQYEGLMPQLVQDGERYTATVDWVQSAPSPSQGFAVKMVAATGDVKTEPAFEGAPQVNASGEKLYSLPTTTLSVGQTQRVTVSFVRAAAGTTPAQPVSGGDGSPVLTALFSMLAAAVIALVIVAARSKRRTAE